MVADCGVPQEATVDDDGDLFFGVIDEGKGRDRAGCELEHFHESLRRGEAEFAFGKELGKGLEVDSFFGADGDKVVLIPFFVADEEIFGVTAHFRKLVFFTIFTGEEWWVVELFEGNGEGFESGVDESRIGAR